MAEFPREVLDGCARFALGLLPWSAWESWFVMRAKAIQANADAETVELLWERPQEGVPRLLAECGAGLRARWPQPPDTQDAEVSAEEYAIYSALFRADGGRAGGIFDDRTEGEKTAFGRGRLEFDAALREYYVVEEELRPTSRLVRPDAPPAPWKRALAEMQPRYEWLNRRRWPLEKRFEPAGGCRFPAECAAKELDSYRVPIGLSRVGFAGDGRFGLVYIRYGVQSGEYVVLERADAGWREVETWLAWMS